MALRRSAFQLARSSRVLSSLRMATGFQLLARQPRSFSTAAATKPKMFCYQCEQTAEHKGCTVVGNCGKTSQTSAIQDLTVHVIKGVCQYAHRARVLGAAENPKLNHFVMEVLFATMTNVNFDSTRFAVYISQALKLRDQAKQAYLQACQQKGVAPEVLEGPATWTTNDLSLENLEAQGNNFGVLERKEELGADISSLQDLILFGVKGTCAYASHALALGQESTEVHAEIQQTMSELTDLLHRSDAETMNKLVGLTLGVGKTNVTVMQMLDAGHTGRFGHPVPTQVRTTPVQGKSILVSGHDLRDLEALLEATKDQGINIYTHGEMLPAHGYPGLKKYPHLAGHYGGPWQLQKLEFAQFPGPILMTTNCIIEPRKSYKDRIFTTNAVGWPGVRHLEHHDFGTLIEYAKHSEGFEKTDPETKPLTVGFHHNTILSVADQVLGAVHGGKLRHVFLIGGCDGSEGERSYYSKLAKGLPSDTLVLTLGCGKYRFNKHEFGNLPGTGLPRLLDMGQCNDAYGAVVVASTLAKALNCGVNDLPLSLALSWFEQKAVAVLLSLLHLGVKRIRIGPALPAFLTPNVLELLIKTFDLKAANIQNVEQDIELMLQKQ